MALPCARSADYDSVEYGEQIIDTAVEAFGGVDILINNAGILRDKSFRRMSEADWELIMTVHLKGVFACTKAAWDIMYERGFGRIVNVASPAGLYGNVGQANYATAKMGMMGLTQTLGKEARRSKKDINVNCIAPGATKSGRFVATVKDGTQGAAFQNEKFRERFLKQMEEEEDNIGRPGSVDEVARVVDFFAGPLGSFVSGEVLKVDGGVARL